MVEQLKKVYDMLADEQSKDIYRNKVLYTLTKEEEYTNRMFKYQLDYLKGCQEIQNMVSEVKQLIDGRNVIIYGIGNYGKMFMELLKWFIEDINIIAFCDKKSDSVKKAYGYSVISLSELSDEKEDYIVLVTPQYYQEEIKESLLLNGIKDEKIYLTHKHPVLVKFQKMEFYNQYFDKLLKWEADEVFVDAGCLDCETSFEFAKRCSNYQKIIAFEPDERNFKVCEEIARSSFNQRMEVYNWGLWDKEENLYFKSSFTTSTISDEGDYKIQVNKLDNVVNGERVSFIKMDIEGAELNALKGAEQTIRKWKPKLAICIYHKLDDIIDIPLYIHSLDLGYKFYIRHYTNSDEETVLYAVCE